MAVTVWLYPLFPEHSHQPLLTIGWNHFWFFFYFKDTTFYACVGFATKMTTKYANHFIVILLISNFKGMFVHKEGTDTNSYLYILLFSEQAPYIFKVHTS